MEQKQTTFPLPSYMDSPWGSPGQFLDYIIMACVGQPYFTLLQPYCTEVETGIYCAGAYKGSKLCLVWVLSAVWYVAEVFSMHIELRKCSTLKRAEVGEYSFQPRLPDPFLAMSCMYIATQFSVCVYVCVCVCSYVRLTPCWRRSTGGQGWPNAGTWCPDLNTYRMNRYVCLPNKCTYIKHYTYICMFPKYHKIHS